MTATGSPLGRHSRPPFLYSPTSSLLAQEYALRFAAAYPGGVFWLRAHGHDDRGDSLTPEARDVERDTQLLAFAHDLQLATDGVGPDELPGLLAGELDRRGAAFLWIVDDVPPGLGGAALEAWCAPGRYGCTLMTTRSREYAAIGAQLDLGVLSAGEGYELLAKHRAADGHAEQEAARGLVEDLGGHALVLEVTGAALYEERGVRSFAQYRDALRDPDRDELVVAAGLTGELPDGHEASIAATLARSINQLDGPARDFLRLASRLAVDTIAPALVIGVFAHADDLAHDQARERAVAGMRQAASQSLADDEPGADARRVHTLISRTITLLEPDAERADALADSAIDTLTTALRASVSGGVSLDAATLAHARLLAGELHDARQAGLLHEVARHDQLRGDYQLARTQRERVVAALRRLLGDEHPNTLMSMNNLAETLRALGDHAGARDLHEQARGLRPGPAQAS